MLGRADSYETLIRDFRWRIPERFNIAEACCDRWARAEPDRTAIRLWRPGGDIRSVSYGWLRETSDRLAAALRRRGVGAGDRLALLLPQRPETAVAHFAAYKLGAVAVPLAALFGPEALQYRLSHSGAKAIVTDAAGLAKLAEINAELPGLEAIFCTEGPAGRAEGFSEAIGAERPEFTPVATGPDDPALMIYTSGTTGPPKGALHGHRVLLGHLPGFAYTHEFAPQPGDRAWTPADWAWAGGLLNLLLPSLYFGIPVVAGPFQRFDPDAAFALMADCRVRNLFMPPTALRMLQGEAEPRRRFDLRLRTIGAAGEALGQQPLDWARRELGMAINEFYGQTECNYVLGSCAALGVIREGAIGKPIPGHRVALLDEAGREAPAGTQGEIAIHRADPSMFLGYWQNPEATAVKFTGDWMLTGDRGVADGDGYVRFIGRSDDLITSAAYRIGPGEVEDCLAGHPAVALAAVVGKPDPLRTEIVKAYVMLLPGTQPSPELEADIKRYVRARLSPAEYPREIAFVEEIPLTTTGKVIRRTFRDRARAEAEREAVRPETRKVANSPAGSAG